MVTYLWATSVKDCGGNENLFANRKERGGELFISRLTFVLGIIFFILCMYKGF